MERCLRGAQSWAGGGSALDGTVVCWQMPGRTSLSAVAAAGTVAAGCRALQRLPPPGDSGLSLPAGEISIPVSSPPSSAASCIYRWVDAWAAAVADPEHEDRRQRFEEVATLHQQAAAAVCGSVRYRALGVGVDDVLVAVARDLDSALESAPTRPRLALQERLWQSFVVDDVADIVAAERWELLCEAGCIGPGRRHLRGGGALAGMGAALRRSRALTRSLGMGSS